VRNLRKHGKRSRCGFQSRGQLAYDTYREAVIVDRGPTALRGRAQAGNLKMANALDLIIGVRTEGEREGSKEAPAIRCRPVIDPDVAGEWMERFRKREGGFFARGRSREKRLIWGGK